MINSILYHSLPTIRKMRRILRKAAKQANRDMFGCSGKRSSLVLRDEQGRDVLKTRRWRNRFMTTNLILTKWN